MDNVKKTKNGYECSFNNEIVFIHNDTEIDDAYYLNDVGYFEELSVYYSTSIPEVEEIK